MEIKKTKDYAMFKLHLLNRPTGESKYKKLSASIGELDLTDCRPVLINQEGVIIDGQHTMKACELLGLPVYYVQKTLTEDETIRAMILLNTLQSTWSMSDYVDHYAHQGIDSYKKCQLIREEYGFTVSASASIVTNKSSSESRQLRNGKLKEGKIDPIWIAETIINDFKPHFQWWAETSFIRSLIQLFNHDLYSHKRDYAKLKLYRHSWDRCADPEHYLQMFTDILNKKRMKENYVDLTK